MIECTLAMLKPEAGPLAREIIGRIKAQYRIIAIKSVLLQRAHVEMFYAEHRDKAFFETLCDCMTKGPVVPMVLRGTDVIASWRRFMGATNPSEAIAGTLRHMYARRPGLLPAQNMMHGSDSYEAAEREIKFFFSKYELILIP